MSAHTPKPWRARGAVVFGPDIDGVPYLVAGSNAFVGAHYSPKRDEAEANARLIAAAPTLVAALEGLMEAVPTQTNDRDWWPDELTRAMAAARKALDEAGIEP